MLSIRFPTLCPGFVTRCQSLTRVRHQQPPRGQSLPSTRMAQILSNHLRRQLIHHPSHFPLCPPMLLHSTLHSNLLHRCHQWSLLLETQTRLFRSLPPCPHHSQAQLHLTSPHLQPSALILTLDWSEVLMTIQDQSSSTASRFGQYQSSNNSVIMTIMIVMMTGIMLTPLLCVGC